MIKISTEENNNAVIISLSGEITMETVNEIDNTCKKYLNQGLTVAAIDLQNVIFIDSFGISRVIKLSKAFTVYGTDFILINMNDNIKQIFKIATFDRLFTIMTKTEFSEKYLK